MMPTVLPLAGFALVALSAGVLTARSTGTGRSAPVMVVEPYVDLAVDPGQTSRGSGPTITS
jgi:hypothetical protein